MPKTVDLTAETIAMLAEGVLGRMIDHEMKVIANDLEERGHDGKKRKLNITIEFQANSKTGRYDITPAVQAKLPPQQGFTTQAKMTFDPEKKGQVFLFNPDSVVPDQSTINDVRSNNDEE